MLNGISKTYLLGLLAFVIISIIGLIDSCNGRRARRQLDEMRSMLEAYKDTTRHWQNKFGEEVASRKVVEGELENMKEFFTKEEIRELEKKFDVKFENIKTLIRLTSQGTTTLLPAKPEIVFVDSSQPCNPVTAMEQEFGNSYYQLRVRTGQGAYARLLAFDTTTIAVKRAYKRRFLSKEWFTQVDAINANDSVRNTVQGAFVIKDRYRDKFFDIHARAGYRHFPANTGLNSLYGGVGGSVNLGRINLSASYNIPITGSGGKFVEGIMRVSVLRL